jgi:hypothetical protein
MRTGVISGRIGAHYAVTPLSQGRKISRGMMVAAAGGAMAAGACAATRTTRLLGRAA